MVYQYPNQEVVDGTAALAGVPVMSVADAKRNVEPRTHLAKVAFDIRDSAVDAHQGTRVTTVTHARCWHFVGFRPRPKNPPFRVVRLTTAPLAQSVDLAAAERPNALRTDAHAATCAAAAHRRARDARVVVPRARAGSTFSTSGLFIRNLKPASVRLLTSPPLSSRRPRRWRTGETRGLRGGLTRGTSPSHARTLPLSLPQARSPRPPSLVCRTETTLHPARDSVCQGGMCLSFSRAKIRFFSRFRLADTFGNQNARRTIYEQSYARARSRAHALTPLLPSTPSPEP